MTEKVRKTKELTTEQRLKQKPRPITRYYNDKPYTVFLSNRYLIQTEDGKPVYQYGHGATLDLEKASKYSKAVLKSWMSTEHSKTDEEAWQRLKQIHEAKLGMKLKLVFKEESEFSYL
jgi:hypothetical protein